MPLKSTKKGLIILVHTSSIISIATTNSSLNDGGLSQTLQNTTWTLRQGTVSSADSINPIVLTDVWSKCYKVNKPTQLVLPDLNKNFTGAIFIEGVN